MEQSAGQTAVLTPYDEIIQALASGLREEIRAVSEELKRWGGHNPPGILVGTYEGYDEHHTYRLELKRPLFPPENTGVALELGSERVRGWVDEIEADGLAIWVQLEERIKSDPKEYTLSFDPTFVLNATLNLLLQLAAENQPVGLSAIERLFGLRESHIECGPPLPHDIADGLNDDQVRLVRTIDASDLVVGFGPPGTGKTRTGAAAIAYLAEKRNLRVLVTAHTNTALDTLMAAVVERLPSWVGNGKIVRSGRLSRDFQHLGIGYKDFKNRAYAEHAAEINATLNALEAEADVLLPPLAQPSHDVSFALLRRKRQQRTSRARKSDPTLRIEAIAARLAAQGAPVEGTPLAALASRLEGLRKTIRDGIGHPEKTARIVGATFSKLAVEPDAFNRYDVVVADEASMAQLAQMAIAAARAARRVLVLGDARQLPPIVQSRAQSAQEWLKRNVYVQLGLEDPASSDPRSVLLRTQYRMAPAIRAVVSELFYSGLLVDADSVKARRGAVELRLLDTSEFALIEVDAYGREAVHLNESESSGKSRVNPCHADIVARLVRELHDAGETDVAIITPFNAQVKLIREALRSRGIAGGFWAMGGTVSTIHRAQGGERDAVILDLVDAPGRNGGTRGMSSFLDASWNKDLPNLINVAISRARRRLIVIAHAQGFRQRYGPGSLIFDLLTRVYREGAYTKVPPHRSTDSRPAPLLT